MKLLKPKTANYKAFTLAEVLTTLMVIGIVAALTIPNLTQSFKKNRVETSLKQVYSLLNEALKMSELENGNKTDWEYPKEPSKFADQYLFPYLKMAYICGKRSDESCFKGDKETYTFLDMNGRKRYYANEFYTGIMANGMSIGVWTDFNQCKKMAQIAIDIDGPKNGPGMLGRDIFMFSLQSIDNKDVSLVPGQVNRCWEINPLNYTIEELLSNDIEGGCHPDAKEVAEQWSGGNCSTAIAKNGWKIPENYPIKF